MKVINNTSMDASMLGVLVREYDTENVTVYLKNTRAGSQTPYSGVCYYKLGKIRVSVNPRNLYPVPIRVGSPFDRSSWEYYMMKTPEELMHFVFLHEISHYLDYRNGIPVRCKQTKADTFALKKLGFIDS
jgi:hypothetical protein